MLMLELDPHTRLIKQLSPYGISTQQIERSSRAFDTAVGPPYIELGAGRPTSEMGICL